MIMLFCVVGMVMSLLETEDRDVSRFFFLMIRRPPISTLDRSSAASDVYKRQVNKATGFPGRCVPRGIETGGCGVWGYVGIDHGNEYITQYGHLSRIDVQSDDEIKAGALIGLTGQSSPPKKDKNGKITNLYSCLLYTSDAADERSSVDLGGSRIIKKQKTKKKK